MPEYLLASRVRSLGAGKLRRFPNCSAAFEFNQLVNHVQMRSIARSRKRRSHTESIDGSLACKQVADAVFVQVAGRKDLYIFPSGAIEFAADPAAVFRY